MAISATLVATGPWPDIYLARARNRLSTVSAHGFSSPPIEKRGRVRSRIALVIWDPIWEQAVANAGRGKNKRARALNRYIAGCQGAERHGYRSLKHVT